MQAWALQTFLESLGHEPAFVDYQPSYLTTGGKLFLPLSGWAIRANLINAFLYGKRIKWKVFGDNGLQRKFSEFQAKHLKTLPKRYVSNEQLLENPPIADSYICGSDQIWNASGQYGVDPSYFLNFVPSAAGKVAYAASFGRPYVEKPFTEQVGELIRDFDSISVRESSGVRIVKELIGREAAWMPDPTLLLENGYPQAVDPQESSPYIFSYSLRNNSLVSKVEIEISNETGINVLNQKVLLKTRNVVLSPLQWLGYLKSAEIIITNSYHGTLFSIIFERPFIFVELSGSKAGYNERSHSLLKALKLTGRIVNSADAKRIKSILSSEIDWAGVRGVLNTWRSSAGDFLKTSLQ